MGDMRYHRNHWHKKKPGINMTKPLRWNVRLADDLNEGHILYKPTYIITLNDQDTNIVFSWFGSSWRCTEEAKSQADRSAKEWFEFARRGGRIEGIIAASPTIKEFKTLNVLSAKEEYLKWKEKHLCGN